MAMYLLNLNVPIWYEEAEFVENSPVFVAIKMNRSQVIELFCDKINQEEFCEYIDSKGHNPMVYAAAIRNFEAVNYFSIRGFSLDTEDRVGYSILTIVLIAGNFELASKLLKRGADINYQNKDG